MEARQAFAVALANELDLDLDEQAMAAIDRVLAALWLLGFKIVSRHGKA
jgi:hypothetical protein